MNNSDNEADNKSGKKNTDFGSVLALARKSQNYSIDDICTQLKIPPRIITAIESNDLTALPEPTFTQGYIRSYARFLEISEENVLAMYNQAAPHDLTANLKPRSNLPDEVSSRTPFIKAVTMLLIIAGVTVAIFSGFQYYQEKADVIETERELKEPRFTGNSLDSPGEMLANNRSASIRQNARLSENNELIVVKPAATEAEKVSQISEMEASTTDTTTDTAATNNVEAADEIVAKTLLSAPGESMSEESISEESISEKLQQAAADVDVLKIYAEQGSWMQVHDASNTRLFYNMIPKGGEKSFPGQAPFRILLGNAKTTKLVINDIVIDISKYIRKNNTASFTVSTEQQRVIFH